MSEGSATRVVRTTTARTAALALVVVIATCGVESRPRHDPAPTPATPTRLPIDASPDESATGYDAALPDDMATPPDAPACLSEQIVCDGACTLVQSDPHHCGGCGIDCHGGPCVGGVCQDVCTPFVECGGSCVDLDTDSANCGRCGHACTRRSGCTESDCACVDGECPCEDRDCPCTSPRAMCDGVCVNTHSDSNHCGACGNACTDPCSPLCLAGICTPTCDISTRCCPPGYCADLQNDPNNCGACGVVVPPGSYCRSGAPICPPGTMECDGVCVDPNAGPCGFLDGGAP